MHRKSIAFTLYRPFWYKNKENRTKKKRIVKVRTSTQPGLANKKVPMTPSAICFIILSLHWLTYHLETVYITSFFYFYFVVVLFYLFQRSFYFTSTLLPWLTSFFFSSSSRTHFQYRCEFFSSKVSMWCTFFFFYKAKHRTLIFYWKLNIKICQFLRFQFQRNQVSRCMTQAIFISNYFFIITFIYFIFLSIIKRILRENQFQRKYIFFLYYHIILIIKIQIIYFLLL